MTIHHKTVMITKDGKIWGKKGGGEDSWSREVSNTCLVKIKCEKKRKKHKRELIIIYNS